VEAKERMAAAVERKRQKGELERQRQEILEEQRMRSS
jgi:hypothetical protein